jgi:hypothetical protein
MQSIVVFPKQRNYECIPVDSLRPNLEPTIQNPKPRSQFYMSPADLVTPQRRRPEYESCVVLHPRIFSNSPERVGEIGTNDLVSCSPSHAVPVDFVPQETVALSWFGRRSTHRCSHPCWVLPVPPAYDRLRIMARDIPLSGGVAEWELSGAFGFRDRTGGRDRAVRNLTSPPAP